MYTKESLLRLYQYATDEPYSFLYIALTAKRKMDMFFMNLNKKLVVEGD